MMPQPPVSTQCNLSLLVICSFSDRLLVITAPRAAEDDAAAAGKYTSNLPLLVIYPL